jgi:hypothetical protein
MKPVREEVMKRPSRRMRTSLDEIQHAAGEIARSQIDELLAHKLLNRYGSDCEFGKLLDRITEYRRSAERTLLLSFDAWKSERGYV